MTIRVSKPCQAPCFCSSCLRELVISAVYVQASDTQNVMSMKCPAIPNTTGVGFWRCGEKLFHKSVSRLTKFPCEQDRSSQHNILMKQYIYEILLCTSLSCTPSTYIRLCRKANRGLCYLRKTESKGLQSSFPVFLSLCSMASKELIQVSS